MSSIVRPTAAQMTRRMVVLAAAAFAVIVPAVQMGLGWGQSQAEFAANGDMTLRVAGYAFSIWSLIYLGIAAYAVRQALPRTGESTVINRLGWPSAVALVGIGLWIIAAALDTRGATLALISASLLALLIPMLLYSHTIRALAPMDRDRWLTVWPLGLLAGWLTIATPVNFINVATSGGVLPVFPPPTPLLMSALAATAAVGLIVTWRTRLLAYPLPIAWGLIGVFVAEQDRNPVLGYFALGAAAVVVAVAALLVFRPRADR